MTDRRDVFISYRHRTPHATWVREVLVPSLQTDGYSVEVDVEMLFGNGRANDFGRFTKELGIEHGMEI